MMIEYEELKNFIEVLNDFNYFRTWIEEPFSI